jgi:hypothetical protein
MSRPIKNSSKCIEGCIQLLEKVQQLNMNLFLSRESVKTKWIQTQLMQFLIKFQHTSVRCPFFINMMIFFLIVPMKSIIPDVIAIVKNLLLTSGYT